jgi:hypothetical protein
VTSNWLAASSAPPDLVRMVQPKRALVVLLAAGASACGGSSGPATPSPALLQVSGAYQITPTLLQNACGSVTVQPGPAQVAHAPGAADLRISHAGQTYSGRIERTGAFVTDPLVISFAAGSTDTVRLEGRFTTGGFEANVTVDAAHAGAAPCRYVVGWQAAKQGGTNVIPG